MSDYIYSNAKYQIISAPELPVYASLDPNLGLDVCPWLDEYIEFSKTWSPRSYDGYHEAVGLWLLSAIAARRVAIIFGKERYTNLYIIMVGRTTLYAKTTAVNIGKELLQKVGLDFLLLPDESTPQAMIVEMSGKFPENYDHLNVDQKERVKLTLAFAGQRGWFFDEFGQNIQAMMRKEGPYGEFRGILRRFDDTELLYERATISRGRESVSRPYLALLGILTPSDLVRFASQGSMLWGDGYLARMALIVPPESLITNGRFPEGVKVFSSRLLKSIRDWHERLGVPDVNIQSGILTGISSITASKVNLTSEAIEAYYNYDQALRQIMLKINLPDLDGNYGRLPEKALRVAGLFASLANSPVININYWARAQEIAERWRSNLHELYRQVNAEAAKNNSLNNEEKVKKAIIEKSFPTKREIEQYTGLSVAEVDPILEKLKAEGWLIEKVVGKTIRYQRASSENEKSSN